MTKPEDGAYDLSINGRAAHYLLLCGFIFWWDDIAKSYSHTSGTGDRSVYQRWIEYNQVTDMCSVPSKLR